MTLKYYNSTLGIGFNDIKSVYCTQTGKWLLAKEHKGRLVYGNNRIPYTRIKQGIDEKNKLITQYCPF